MNTQASAEITETAKKQTHKIPVSSFLRPTLSSALEERGYSECVQQAQEHILALRSWEDRIFTGDEAAHFSSSMIVAFLSELIEPHDKGHTILSMSSESMKEVKEQLEEAGLKVFELEGVTDRVPEDHTMIIGDAGTLTEFFRSDTGRATSIGRVVLLEVGKLNIEMTKDLLSEACKRGKRPQLVLVEEQTDENLKDLSRSYLRSTAQEETHYFVQVESEGKSRIQTLIDCLEAESLFPALIFCKHSAEANSVEAALNKSGISTAKLAGRVPQQKMRAIVTSAKAGEITAVVCTDGPAENLELESFPLIVNFSIPSEPEIYIHRTETPPGALAERKVLNVITQLDRSNFEYIKKIVAAKFEQSSGPDLGLALERQVAKIKSNALQQIEKCNERIMVLAEKLAQDTKAKEVIAHLLYQIENATPPAKDKNRKRSRDNNEEVDAPRETGRRDRKEKENQSEEREQFRFEVKKTARVYIGHGSKSGLTEEILNKISVLSDTGETKSILNCSIRPSYSFVDIEDGFGEALIEKLKETPPIEVESFVVNKAITISTKEKISDETQSSAEH